MENSKHQKSQLDITNYAFCNIFIDDIENEIWTSAFGLDGLYEVSNLGRVKSLERTVTYIDGRIRTFPTKIIRQCKIKHGKTFSLYVRLTYETGECKSFTVASLILNSFKTPDKYNNKTHHINCISFDNQLKNLCFEDLSSKRKIEFDKNIRDGKKNTKHWKENGWLDICSKRFSPKPSNERIKAKTFEKRNKKAITVWIKHTDFIGSYTCLKNAAENLNIKEQILRNALFKPHKYKRLMVKYGTLSKQEFFNNV